MIWLSLSKVNGVSKNRNCETLTQLHVRKTTRRHKHVMCFDLFNEMTESFNNFPMGGNLWKFGIPEWLTSPKAFHTVRSSQMFILIKIQADLI